MNRKLMAVALSILLVVAFACKKKEQQPIPQVPGMGAPGALPPGHPQAPGMGQLPPGHPQAPGMGAPGGQIMMPKGDLQVVIPPTVKGKWGAVKIVVEDKKTRKTQELTVKLNSDLNIPNSNLKVVVGEFIPDFRMDVGTITSASNNPNNPAVNIKVYEGGKEIFKGWLYSKFPAIHPFEHPKVGLSLKEGVKKG